MLHYTYSIYYIINSVPPNYLSMLNLFHGTYFIQLLLTKTNTVGNNQEQTNKENDAPLMDANDPKLATNKETAERKDDVSTTEQGVQKDVQETNRQGNSNTSIQEEDVKANEQNETRYNQTPGQRNDNPGKQ